MKKRTRLILIISGIVALIATGLVMYLLPTLVPLLLWVLLGLGLALLGVEAFGRWKKHKRQKSFDEKISAREGIEDRKREWSAWTEELNRQGIDRYELPFYLLVGEPQSGKSVLLQNSDLHFPFGQDKLSGVGGTRGCDWWFTDKAVILDIAGRLFTHEGGVADRMEWESFLDLLYSYRPLCPANGVLLIIPCDALLGDSEAEAAEKANKIQSALLTLSQKLQAQLPVYLVLTKGDQIFGFAESVHRLEARNREEMFGWSREADELESGFDMDEVRSGFDELVERARMLRARMMATARVPEALPEIDRLYAFPDELEGLYPTLEIYLKRIFTDSNLTDRMSFRGLYLTSGLQSGVPIAKACVQLMGEKGAGDQRALEGLFQNQRAYFIKDLIRHRVFAEQGLVRPTSTRVMKSRRNAVLGFGAAAVIAAVAIGFSIYHLATVEDPAGLVTIRRALAQADALAADSSAPTGDALNALGSLASALESEEAAVDKMFGVTKPQLRGLYENIFDRRVAPEVHKAMRHNLEDAMSNPPRSSSEFQSMDRASKALIEGLEFADESVRDLAYKWSRSPRNLIGKSTFSLLDAMELRGAGRVELPTQETERLKPLAYGMLRLWDESMSGAAWEPAGKTLSYSIAWGGVARYEKFIDRYKQGDVHEGAIMNGTRFADCLERMAESEGSGLDELSVNSFIFELQSARKSRDFFANVVDPTGERAANWGVADGLQSFMVGIARDDGEGGISGHFSVGVTGLAGEMLSNGVEDLLSVRTAKIDLPSNDIRILRNNEPMLAALRAEPRPGSSIWELRPGLKDAAEASEDAFEQDQNCYQAKAKDFIDLFVNEVESWEQLQVFLPGNERAAYSKLSSEMKPLVEIRSSLLDLVDSGDIDPFDERLNSLIAGYLSTLLAEGGFGAKTKAPEWEFVEALVSVVLARDKGVDQSTAARAKEVLSGYLAPYQGVWLEEWRGKFEKDKTKKSFSRVAKQAKGVFDEFAKAGLLGRNLRSFRKQSEWVRRVDSLLSKRANAFSALLEEKWEPKADKSVSELSSLDDILGELESMFEEDEIQKIIDTVNELDVPAQDAPFFKAGSVFLAPDALEVCRESFTRYGDLMAPETAASVLDLPEGGKVADLIAGLREIQKHGLDRRGAEAASLLLRQPKAEDGYKPKTAGQRYGWLVYQHALRRLAVFVELQYLSAIRSCIEDRPMLKSALWPDKGQVVAPNLSDPIVRTGLHELLDRAAEKGLFGKLQGDYSMHLRTDASGLRPASGDRTAGFQDLWALEEFVRELQSFLYSNDEIKDVVDISLKVQFKVPSGSSKRDTAWDNFSNESYREHLFYGSKSSQRDRKWRSGPDGEFEPLLWSLEGAEVLWFLFTNSPVFTTPVDVIDLGFKGVLAPLTLAWSGRAPGARGGFWELDLQDSADESSQSPPIPIQVKVTPNGSDIALPERPSFPKAPLE